MALLGRFAIVLGFVMICGPVIADTPAGPEVRFHGSNTVGARLAPRLIEAYLKQRDANASFSGWQRFSEPVEVDGQTKQESYQVLDVTSRDSGLPSRIYVRPYGSKTAFDALGAHNAEVGMASRPVKAEELLKLAAIGDMTSDRNEHIIALDGIAVIVNPDNRVSSLTMDQVKRIFACEITDWSQVGGSGGRIQTYARDANSGTYDTFKSLVLETSELCDNARRYEDSTQLVGDVRGDPNGIGFVGMAYVGEGSKGAKALKLDEGWISVGASDFSVKTEEYPLSRRLYFYTPDNTSEFVRGFIRFVKSEEGQRVVSTAASGDDADRYVDLNVGDSGSKEAKEHRLATCRAAAIEVQDPKILGELIRDTQGADRLSVTFRFETAKDNLENRARDDLTRLVDFMKQPENSGRALLLLGFADNKGDYKANCGLSQKRADTVASALRGQVPSPALVRGYCEEAPVAWDDPNQKEGNPKNRRVEAWLR
ncbi:substrate-binding domain-containing protein [Candidatus Thiodictyon syntrophicum]|jgi:phosphate transport system substrate-binding protein|uniref:OmpA-like domain-containing protein n=1 Tax=Candidatus Thiodictyon syntrophicum TaxID=1166950 RepID=A0A2K8U6Q7_9GAMM|nr:phosphate ABC transporter substrate-binding/OmpA family protein [Candidatus Thiodictyon syntrophicum]AUB81235.1 hypothetical protein THSYN_09905 [Candidatus Thiodictyon syntrophicum]